MRVFLKDLSAIVLDFCGIVMEMLTKFKKRCAHTLNMFIYGMLFCLRLLVTLLETRDSINSCIAMLEFILLVIDLLEIF